MRKSYPPGPETATMPACALSTARKMCPLEIKSPPRPHTWVWGLKVHDLYDARPPTGRRAWGWARANAGLQGFPVGSEGKKPQPEALLIKKKKITVPRREGSTMRGNHKKRRSISRARVLDNGTTEIK